MTLTSLQFPTQSELSLKSAKQGHWLDIAALTQLPRFSKNAIKK
jgi:hypothetical protein